jgi:hypothetical protein
LLNAIDSIPLSEKYPVSYSFVEAGPETEANIPGIYRSIEFHTRAFSLFRAILLYV